jgi:hypothetical protein
MTNATTGCPACGGTVSYLANTCPHCGHPLDLAAIDASGATVGQPLRARVEGPDQNWHMSHLYFVARYVLAAVVPLLPLVWNLVVSITAGDSAVAEEGAQRSAAIPGPYQWWAFLALLGLVGLPLVASAVIERLSSQYTLTHDGYVRERRGLFSRHTAELHVSDIRLVNVKQTLWQRLFGVGCLDISSAGHSGVEVQFVGVPDPQRIKERILDRAETSDD